MADHLPDSRAEENLMQAITLALTGDVMLGRLVDESVIRNSAVPPETVWGDVRPLILGADLRLINLECVISDRGSEWRPDSKAFHSDRIKADILRMSPF